jgi:hypothetical protein
MKYVWSLLYLLMLVTASQAQTELKPKEEYKLFVSATKISLTRGQRDSVKRTHRMNSCYSSRQVLTHTLVNTALPQLAPCETKTKESY